MRWRRAILLGAFLSAVVQAGCQRLVERGETTAGTEPAAAISAAQHQGPLVVFLGDSLTAGYGLMEQEAFPALLQERLRQRGQPVRIVNAGVSGDTTAGGLARVDWVLAQKPDVVVLELGANDGLRGLSLTDTRQNLSEIIRRCLDQGARVLLTGMRIPPNYGPQYSEDFAALFRDLAETHGIALMPFLLEGVATVPGLNQADGIHPNAAGHRRLAESVEPHLITVLDGL